MPILRRRKLTPFNLSFLDVMSCGFGAVVLLVLIVNANTVSHRNDEYADLRAKVTRIESEVVAGKSRMAELKNSLEKKRDEVERIRGRCREVLSRIILLKNELSDMKKETIAHKAHVKALESDLKTLDTNHKRLGARIKADRERGEKIRRFEGLGHRQYLTGFKLGGHRVALLVDVSASMLDSTIVGVILRRDMGDAARQSSPKWQRAKKTVSWIVANLPHDSSVQIIPFNTGAASLSESHKWIQATDRQGIDRMMSRFNKIIPSGGTSLEKAFDAVTALSPEPDNIVLITDGLPTQGEKRPGGNTVSGEKRVRLFEQAVRKLPDYVPVNTILFPMEGDPVAAALFWKLAIDTHGSFFTPTRDWP